MRRLLGLALISLFIVITTNAQSVWTPEMQLKTKAIATPRVSPDGLWVAYSVSNEVMAADKSEFVSQVWLGSVDGKQNMQLTFADKSSTNPKWSPDGKWLAFTSSRKDSKNNLYLIRVAGGEAEMITDLKGNVSDYDWSPDGKWIAYSMTDTKSEEEEKNDKGRNDARWVDENIKMSRLYVMPVAKDANGKRDVRKLTADSRSIGGFDWSPDGAKIVYAHVKDPRAEFWSSSDVSMIDVASGTVTSFAATPAAESSPVFSPDGKWIAMTVTDGPVRWAQSNRIHVVPVGGGSAKVMPMSHDGQPGMIGWTPDGSKIMFTEAKGTGTALNEANVVAGTIREVDFQNAAISGVNMTRVGSTYGVGMVQQNAGSPPEVYAGVFGNPGGMIRVSQANNEVAKMTVGKTELVKWKSKDGKEIEGLLTYPNNYVAGTKVPLILNVHGGPAGVFNQSFIGGRGVYPIATFAQKGFAILRPNPRGSSGYGTEFRRANFKDWGGMDYQDLMTGVDHVIAIGVADPERLGVMGWSYGGFMTSYIVTQTKRFKAASAGAAVTNLMSMNGVTDIPGLIADYYGGQSWEQTDLYAKHSAMFNIKGVATPTLIQHGEADVRVPISQGYEFYNALKAQGVPTRMLVLPRQPHGPTEPKMQLAAMQSNLEWFEKYLK